MARGLEQCYSNWCWGHIYSHLKHKIVGKNASIKLKDMAKNDYKHS